MNTEYERIIESENFKKIGFMNLDERRIRKMKEKEHGNNSLDSRVDKKTSNNSYESIVNQDAESKQGLDEKSIKSTLKGNDNVNAQYKHVMENLSKENENYHQSKSEDTPAMKNYKALEQRSSEERKIIPDQTKEKSLKMANQNQRGR